MAKTKTGKSAEPDEPGRGPGRWIARVLIVAGLTAACVGGFVLLRRSVERKYLVATDPPIIVLKDRPDWMREYQAEQIALAVRPRAGRSALDAHLLEEVAQNLRESAWVKQVRQVRRAYGRRPGDTIEVFCEYRAPVAIVGWGDYYWQVDAQGIKLPGDIDRKTLIDIMFAKVEGKRSLNLRVVQGVKNPPPPAGHKWMGEDVAAGLDMARLLAGVPYAEEIWIIDVENFAGRKDNTRAQIALKTQYGTEVHWGEPVNATFHVEAKPAVKLRHLEAIKRQYGRVDGKYPWIDVRFDDVRHPINTADTRN